MKKSRINFSLPTKISFLNIIAFIALLSWAFSLSYLFVIIILLFFSLSQKKFSFILLLFIIFVLKDHQFLTNPATIKFNYFTNFNNLTNDLLNSMIFGVSNSKNNQLYTLFLTLGITHLLVASGSNVNYVKNISDYLFFYYKKNSKLLFSIILILIYSFLAGYSIPILRASSIFILSIIYFIIRRNTSIFDTFSLLLIILFLYNPKIFSSLSFQLSFACSFILILFSKIESNCNQKFKKYTISVIVTYVASIILFLHSKQISHLSLATNVLILPLYELIFLTIIPIDMLSFIPQVVILVDSVSLWAISVLRILNTFSSSSYLFFLNLGIIYLSLRDIISFYQKSNLSTNTE